MPKLIVAGDLVRQPRQLVTDGFLVRAEVRQLRVGANRGVAARDVEADADDGDLVVVGGDAADGHDVADVAVGHQRDALGARGDVVQLLQR